MKPAEITYDLVRAIMEKTATWVEGVAEHHRTAATGYPVGADDVVWFLHGYDPTVKAQGRGALHESREAAKKKFGAYVTAPTSGQIQKCRTLLNQLVDEGLVEKKEQGNYHSFTWITKAMQAARDAAKTLVERTNSVSAALAELLPNDSRDGYGVMVFGQTIEHAGHRGEYRARITVQMEIEAAQRLIAVLTAVKDVEEFDIGDGRRYTLIELPEISTKLSDR